MVNGRYTEEEHSFLHSFIPGHTYKEIVVAYNEKFSDPITVARVKGYMANHKLNNGLTGRFKKGHIPKNKGTHQPTVGRMAETQFKKGHLPYNTKPLGYERISKDGYIEVKVNDNPNTASGEKHFVLKHRLVWEQANGLIPKGSKIVFLDGDKTNTDINNLALVSSAENLQMIRENLRSTNAELTKTGIMIAKVGISVKNAGRKIKNKKGKV